MFYLASMASLALLTLLLGAHGQACMEPSDAESSLLQMRAEGKRATSPCADGRGLQLKPAEDYVVTFNTTPDGCNVYAAQDQMATVSGPDQAYMLISAHGAANGVIGDKECTVATHGDWAKWEYADCKLPPVWALVWQGATSVANFGQNFKRVSATMKVPEKPTAKDVKHEYTIWGFGMQPALQLDPPIPAKGTFCDLEGNNDTIVFNSGQFCRILWHSDDFEGLLKYGTKLFNLVDYVGEFIYTCNVLLGKSETGPAFGFGGVAKPGEWVFSENLLGMHSPDLPPSQKGWQNSMGIEGTSAKIDFAFNSSVYEYVFLEKAVEEKVVKVKSSQAELVRNNSWGWAVGPPYEWSIIVDEPPLEEIPKLWPAGTVHYKNVKLETTDGTFRQLNGKDWLLNFDQGLEFTGTVLGGLLFTDYDALEDYIANLQDNITNGITTGTQKVTDVKAVCLYKCVKSRRDGSGCTPNADGSFDCQLKFGDNFPPEECTPTFWK